jgi:hypothetical protein
MKIIILSICISIAFNVKSQILGIDETISYINNIFENIKLNGNVFNLWTPNYYRVQWISDNQGNILISGKGQRYYDFQKKLKLIRNGNHLILNDTYSDGSGLKTNNLFMEEIDFFINGENEKLKLNFINGFNFLENGPGLLIYCKSSKYSSCINGYFGISLQHESQDPYYLKKLYNAFKYLKSLAELDKTFNRDIDDPFTDENFFEKMESYSAKTATLNIKTNNALNYISIDIPSIGIHEFIYDTGASISTMNEEIEKKLWANKIITKDSYLSSALFKIADGTVVEARRLKVPNLIIGNLVLKDIVFAVTSGDLLLSNSAFKGFNKFSLDRDKKILTVSE